MGGCLNSELLQGELPTRRVLLNAAARHLELLKASPLTGHVLGVNGRLNLARTGCVREDELGIEATQGDRRSRKRQYDAFSVTACQTRIEAAGQIAAFRLHSAGGHHVKRIACDGHAFGIKPAETGPHSRDVACGLAREYRGQRRGKYWFQITFKARVKAMLLAFQVDPDGTRHERLPGSRHRPLRPPGV